MFAGLQALLTIPVLSIQGWIIPECVILSVQVSVTVLCRIWQSLQGSFHANWEGKGDFSLERYFCRNRSSLEFCGFLFHLTFQDIFKSPFHVSPEDSYFFVQLGLTLCRPDPEHFLSSFVGVVIAGGPEAMKQSGMCPDFCFAQSFQKCHSGFHPKC